MTDDGGAGSPVRIDISNVDLDRYSALIDYLDAEGVYFASEAGAITAPASRAVEVSALVEPVFATGLDTFGATNQGVTNSLRSWRTTPKPGDLAPYVTRPIGWIIDTVAVTAASIITIVVADAVGVGTGPEGRSAIALAWSLLALVVAVAITGRSIGGLAVGIRIVRHPDFGQPGWPHALVRWVVPWAATAVPAAVGQLIGDRRIAVAVGTAGFVMWLVVHLTMFGQPDRRGVHDVLARTVLVRGGAVSGRDEAEPPAV